MRTLTYTWTAAQLCKEMAGAAVFGLLQRWRNKSNEDDLEAFGREIMPALVRAAAEGERRAMVNAALGTEGIKFEAHPDNDQYCINVVVASVQEVMVRAGCRGRKPHSAEMFAGQILALVLASHVCRLVGARFELVAFTATIPLFARYWPLDRQDELTKMFVAAMQAYNEITTQKGLVLDLGQDFAEWIAQPRAPGFDRLVDWFARLIRLSGGEASA